MNHWGNQRRDGEPLHEYDMTRLTFRDTPVPRCDICNMNISDYMPGEWRCGACCDHYGDEEGNPPLCDCHTEVVPKYGERRYLSEIANLSVKIEHQRKWIDECGGTREEYRRRYGVAGQPGCYGDGGDAIFDADMRALFTLLEEHRQLSDKTLENSR